MTHPTITRNPQGYTAQEIQQIQTKYDEACNKVVRAVSFLFCTIVLNMLILGGVAGIATYTKKWHESISTFVLLIVCSIVLNSLTASLVLLRLAERRPIAEQLKSTNSDPTRPLLRMDQLNP